VSGSAPPDLLLCCLLVLFAYVLFALLCLLPGVIVSTVNELMFLTCIFLLVATNERTQRNIMKQLKNETTKNQRTNLQKTLKTLKSDSTSHSDSHYAISTTLCKSSNEKQMKKQTETQCTQ
jgi:hypothetical protein